MSVTVIQSYDLGYLSTELEETNREAIQLVAVRAILSLLQQRQQEEETRGGFKSVYQDVFNTLTLYYARYRHQIT